ncbi:hypothetical protein C662_04078 [Thauera sp. 28]|nr:hypothetical protein B447_19384 [Thauera sp. 27]ENO94136.1 hypothetical protein C662_04078 [Thauera sp. 28]
MSHDPLLKFRAASCRLRTIVGSWLGCDIVKGDEGLIVRMDDELHRGLGNSPSMNVGLDCRLEIEVMA